MMDDKPFWVRMFALAAILYGLVWFMNHQIPGGVGGLLNQSSTDYQVQTNNGCQMQTRDNDTGAVISVRPCGVPQTPTAAQ